MAQYDLVLSPLGRRGPTQLHRVPIDRLTPTIPYRSVRPRSPMAASLDHQSVWAPDAETLLDSVPMPVSRLALDGTILWANRAELELLGYTEDEYVGHHLAEFHADLASCSALLARIRHRES